MAWNALWTILGVMLVFLALGVPISYSIGISSLAGTFMDVTPAILIFTPLFLPVVEAFGMHPVQFGLILVYNLCIGNITPPVGNTLFVAIKVGKTSLSEVMPYMLWYYGAILSGLLLVTFVPAVSLGLPWLTGVLK